MVYSPRPPSRRSVLAAEITRRSLRPVADVLPANQLGIAASRQIVAGALRLFGRIPPGTGVVPVDTREPGPVRGRIRGEWVTARDAAPPEATRAAILYLHGSGYALCSPRTHRGLTSQLSALTGLPLFCVDYRLAPRHRFPRAAQDVARAWDWLLAHGLPADRIVVAGDSAGGHLALDLCLALHRAGRSQPAALVLLSPIADLTLGLARAREQVRDDPMITASAARRLVGLYTRGTEAVHARLAHAIGHDEVLAPTLIQAGGREMLAADAHHLHRALLASGTHCELQVWPGQMHVFQAMPRLIPEADQALRRAAGFAMDALAVRTSGAQAPARDGTSRHNATSWRSA
jgi:acetyl esterase/lipase